MLVRMEEALKKKSQRQRNRSVCGSPKRQLRGLNVVELYEFALMNDLVTHYQLLNFVNL